MTDPQLSIPSQFIWYAATFRLGVLGCGIACVALGYFLLTKAIGRKNAANGSFSASVGTAQVSMQNLAPGTMFAAFGMIIVGAMLYQGMPELQQRNADDNLTVRSGDQRPSRQEVASLTERAANLEQAGNFAAATEAYEQALDSLAVPAGRLAALYLQQNRGTEALALAKLAADLRPFRADIVRTLASAYEQAGHHEGAVKAAQRAAELDPKYRSQLEDLMRKK